MPRTVESPLRRRALLVTLPLTALVVLLSACGGGSSKASTATSSTTVAATSGTGASSTGRAAYTSCLESHGVPASVASSFNFGGRRRTTGGSSTTTGGSGSTPPQSFTRPSIPSQYQAAFTTCRSQLPGGGTFGGGLNSAALAAYRNCLEVNGVTIPTTTTVPGGSSTPGFGGGGFAGLSSQPAFKAASQKCAALLPARPGPTTSTTLAS